MELGKLTRKVNSLVNYGGTELLYHKLHRVCFASVKTLGHLNTEEGLHLTSCSLISLWHSGDCVSCLCLGLTSRVWISPPERTCLHHRWTSCSSDRWSILGDISVPLRPVGEIPKTRLKGNSASCALWKFDALGCQGAALWSPLKTHQGRNSQQCFSRDWSNRHHEALITGRRSRARSGHLG